MMPQQEHGEQRLFFRKNKMYDYINHVLSSYFSSANELSEQEAISTLRVHLDHSPELKRGLYADLTNAFNDENFSLVAELEESDVLYFESEEDALKYAKRILWKPFFDDD